MTLIFDRKKILQHRNQASSNYKHSKFFGNLAEGVMDRLEPLNKDYSAVLDINCRNGNFTQLFRDKHTNAKIIATDISSKMLDSFKHQYKWQIDEELITSRLIEYNPDIGENYFDLINFSLGLHWINNVEEFLEQIYSLLKSDGIFIANFIGGDSLKKLRTELINIESILEVSHHSRISPFIYFQHVPALLQRAGFKDIIVDQDEIAFTYPSSYELMKEIKELGESSGLVRSSNYSLSKKMISSLSVCNKQFHDKINIISFIAGKDKNTIKMKT
ncbi:MAG: methyltransferase domain-containing protein [Janthinobacterium lividum]